MECVRRHMTDIAMCGRCHVDSETTLHVLRDWYFPTHIWLGLVPQEQWLEFFSLSLQDWLCWNLSNYSSYNSSLKWSLIFGVACWVLWQWRNKSIFDDGFYEVSYPIGFIKFKARQFHQAILFEVSEQSRSSKQCCLIGWDLPPKGWYEINSDGTMKTSSGISSAGGLLRDDQGRWMAGFAVNLGRFSVQLW